MKTDEMPHLAVKATGNAGRSTIVTSREAYQRFRLLATMVQGTAAALPEAWQSYRNVDEARLAAQKMMRNHRVVRVAIVQDRIPLQFVEWVRRSRTESMSTLPHNLPLRILEGSPDAIVMCDRTGTVRYWNAAAERVFGFSVAEALGVSLNLIIPERLRARHWAGWEEAMRTGLTRYGKGQLLAVPALHKDGRRISIEFSIQFIKDTDGQTKWVVAVIRDVTERYLREKALRAQVKPLTRPSDSPRIE